MRLAKGIDAVLREALIPPSRFSIERFLQVWSNASEAERQRAVAVAARGRVLPLLGWRALLGGIDEPSLEPAIHAYHATFYRNRFFLETSNTLAYEFQRSGIRAVFYSGPFLLERIYREAGARGMMDIDVLVEAGQLAAAQAIATQFGFEPVIDSTLTDLKRQRFGKLELLEWQTHPSGFWGVRDVLMKKSINGRPLYLEIQQWISRPGMPIGAIEAELLAPKTIYPNPEAAFCAMVLHTFDKDAGLDLRAATDLLWLWEAAGTDKLLECASRLKILRAVRAGLGFVQDVFELPSPLGTLKPIETIGLRFIAKNFSQTRVLWRLRPLQKFAEPLLLCDQRLRAQLEAAFGKLIGKLRVMH